MRSVRNLRDLLLVALLLVPAALWATAPAPALDAETPTARTLKDIILTKQDVLMGGCPTGQVMQTVEADGAVTCASVAADVHSHVGARWVGVDGNAALTLTQPHAAALVARGDVGVDAMVTSENGTAVKASAASGNAVALELGGSLRVPQTASAPVFVHVTSQQTIHGDRSDLAHPVANAHQDAMLVVTPRDGRVRSASVIYDESRRCWSILTGDGAVMPAGAQFNVMVVLP